MNKIFKNSIEDIKNEIVLLCDESILKKKDTIPIIYALSLDIEAINEKLKEIVEQKYNISKVLDDHWRVVYSLNSLLAFDTYNYKPYFAYKTPESNNSIFLKIKTQEHVKNKDDSFLDLNTYLFKTYGVNTKNKKLNKIVEKYLYDNLYSIQQTFKKELEQYHSLTKIIMSFLSKASTVNEHSEVLFGNHDFSSTAVAYKTLKEQFDLFQLSTDIDLKRETQELENYLSTFSENKKTKKIHNK